MSYSWGSDSGSSSSGMTSGRGADFSSARKAYEKPVHSAPRSHKTSMRSTPEPRRDFVSRVGRTPAPVGKEISTESTHPIVVAVDVTGSMQSWPGIIFEKLPLLGKEIERYAPDYAISFTAFGDAIVDSYPLQVRDFDSGEALDGHIHDLYPEGQGGDEPEDPQLVAYYYLNHCKIDKAVKPIFVFITDAPFHDSLSSISVKKFTGDIIQSDLDSGSIIKKLTEKFTVYVVLKDYDDEECAGLWKGVVGAQQVLPFEEPRDIVEVLIGIVAGELGELKDFEMRSSKRHSDRPDRVSRVKKSLKSVKDKAAEAASDEGKSKRTDVKSGEKSLKSKKLT